MILKFHYLYSLEHWVSKQIKKYYHILFILLIKWFTNELLDLLKNSIKDSHPIFNQRHALRLLNLNTKGKDIINVIDTLNNNLFPNYQNNKEKAIYLGYVVRQILLTHLGLIQETDRDSYSNKTIDLAGPLLLEPV